MHVLVAAAIALMTPTSAGDFGAAPPDTLNPPESVRRMGSLFANCEFTAVQTGIYIQPCGSRYTNVYQIKGKLCDDAIVLQRSDLQKQRLDRKGKPIPDTSPRYAERRWTRGDLGLELVLQIPRSGRWPTECWPPEIPKLQTPRIGWINVFSETDADRDLIWGTIPLGDFLEGMRVVAGFDLAEVVTESGRLGYMLQRTWWGSADHSIVGYEFASPEFGTATTIFTKSNDQWMPTELTIVHLAHHRYIADESVASEERVENAQFVSEDFEPPAPRLDQMEVSYRLAYNPLPVSIERRDRYIYKSQESTVDIKLEFSSFRSGDVNCDEVERAMLRIPDHCEVHPKDQEEQKLAWTTRDGKVVKSVDSDAVAVAGNATFSSSAGRRLRIIVTALVVAILLCAVLYRRTQQVPMR